MLVLFTPSMLSSESSFVCTLLEAISLSHWMIIWIATSFHKSLFIRKIISKVDGSICLLCGRMTSFALLNNRSQMLDVGHTSDNATPLFGVRNQKYWCFQKYCINCCVSCNTLSTFQSSTHLMTASKRKIICCHCVSSSYNIRHVCRPRPPHI